MQIAHITKKSHFFHNVSYQFEKAFEGQNSYFLHTRELVSQEEKEAFSKVEQIYFVGDKTKDIADLFERIQKFDIVFLHGLDMFSSRLMLFADMEPKVVFLFFGGEIYENSKILKSKPFGNLTIKKYNNFDNRKERFIENSLYRIKYVFDTLESKIKKAIQKIDYFAVVHKEDYDFMIANKVMPSSVKYFKFSFYPIEFLYNNEIDTSNSGNNILIGNSRSYANNHLEIFSILSKFNIANRKVIVPLSYGNMKGIDSLVQNGKENLGDRFSPLLELMPLHEYNKMLSTCSVAIMNHYRQQAVGNIIALVYSGAKVYLSSQNTIYHFLKRIGCNVYSVENDLITSNINALEPLPREESTQNKEILYRFLNTKKLIEDLRKDILSIPQ
jgi:dTDP-N-acetylfucosamine:lipid II N-acetylfucosaminyltransferase